MNATPPSPQPTRPLRALSPTEIVTRLARHPGWRLSGDGDDLCIEKSYGFADYAAALAFTNAVALAAEARQHHPEITLRPRACVLRWRTHDVQGLSERDFEAAARADALLEACTAGKPA